jgi:hypothetical protein
MRYRATMAIADQSRDPEKQHLQCRIFPITWLNGTYGDHFGCSAYPNDAGLGAWMGRRKKRVAPRRFGNFVGFQRHPADAIAFAG